MRKCFLLILHFVWFVYINCDPIHTVVKWKRLQFAYESEERRQADIKAKIYDIDAPAAIDVDVFYNKITNERWLFVTMPKFGSGVPVTFGYVTKKYYNDDPLIAPFPSWEWHRNKKCSRRLSSVFRVKVDKCGLLWILDSGNEGEGVICPPKVVVFDLKKWPNLKEPVHTYQYKSEVYTNDSIFVTPIVQIVGSNCNTAKFYVYAADTINRAIVFTNMFSGQSKRFQHKSMNPEEPFSTFNIAGSTFELDDGVLGMDLSPDESYLYYSAFAGSFESRLDTKVMRERLTASIQTYPTPRKSQSAAMAISKNGIALFGLMSNITINCWNTKLNDYGNNIQTVYYNNYTMQFPSGAKIVQNNREEFWVLTSRLQKAMTTGYDFNEVNFRISMGYTSELTMPCHEHHYHNNGF